MSNNSILIRRANKFLVEDKGTKTRVSNAALAAFNKNLQDLGYTLSAKAIRTLQKPGVSAPFSEIVDVLKELRGVRNYRPMYPNFPTQVLEADEAELYLNAIFHYFSFVVADAVNDSSVIWLPKYKKDRREPLDEKVQLTVLEIGTEDDLAAIAARIAMSNTSISATDKEDLRSLIKDGYLHIGAGQGKVGKIPNKENLAVVGAVLLTEKMSFGLISEQFKTATDVLRLATALSDGDVSLAADTKFKSLPRYIRRVLVSILEAAENREEDMLRHENRWVKLGHSLHMGEFYKRFPFSYEAMLKLRNKSAMQKDPIRTFGAKVEMALREGEVRKAITLLAKRPGEFARRLDHLMRLDEDRAEATVDAFEKVADDVSTPVLLQVMAHFKARNTSSMRVAMPKGSIAKVQVLPPTTWKLDYVQCQRVAEVCTKALTARFSKLAPLGKVYVDEKLQNYLVPFSQRSANKSLRTIVRGSQIDLAKDKDTIRFFIWWKNIDDPDTKAAGWSGDGRVDLDLSAVIFDENWKSLTDIAWYNLRADSGYSHFRSFKACHSGDITNAPKGASEFIDIDIPGAVAYGARYVVMDVRCYTGQNLNTIPECSAGWMLREKPKSGEVYEPKTVVDRIDVASEATSVMPLVIDLVERKVIWMDIVSTNRRAYNTAAGNREQVALLADAFTKIRKPNLYELLSAHANGRGKQVFDPAKADVVFSVESGIQFELDKIASEYMLNEAPAKPKAKAAKKR